MVLTGLTMVFEPYKMRKTPLRTFQVGIVDTFEAEGVREVLAGLTTVSQPYKLKETRLRSF